MSKSESTSGSFRTILRIALLGAFLAVIAPSGLSAATISAVIGDDSTVGGDSSVGNDSSVGGDSSVGDDSSVGNDSSVADDSSVANDSSPEGEAVLRLDSTVINDNGGDFFEEWYDARFWSTSFAAKKTGDVVVVAAEQVEIWYTLPPGYDVVDMRCVRTSDGALVSNSFSQVSYGPGAGPWGLLIVNVNDGADLTCSVLADDAPVTLHLHAIADDSSPSENLITNIGNEIVVGSDTITIDGGLHDFSSGTVGYELNEMVCTPYYGYTIPQISYFGAVQVELNNYETHCIAHFEALATPTASISISPTIIDDHGGDLQPADAPVYVDGSLAGSTVVVEPGEHKVRAFAVAGYTKSTLVCTDDSDGSPVALINHKLDLAADQAITCTITYNDLPGRITFATSFDYGTADARVIFGSSTVRAGQFRARGAGQYIIGSKPVDGYVFDGVTCVSTDGDVQTGGNGDSITVSNGVTMTCTYNYLSKPLRVLFQVEVVNDNGGTLEAGTPRVTFGTVTTRHNQFRKLSAGQYATGAVVPAGYELAGVDCVEKYGRPVTMNNGVVDGEPAYWLTCTYTFDDLAS